MQCPHKYSFKVAIGNALAAGIGSLSLLKRLLHSHGTPVAFDYPARLRVMYFIMSNISTLNRL